MYQYGGYAYIQGYNTGSGPIYPSSAGGVAIASNFSNGNAEIDIWNTFLPGTYPNTGIRFLQQLTSNSYRDLMFLSNNGNVGIGTISPSQPLQVAGTIYSSSGGFKFPDGTTQTTSAGVVSLIAGANISLSGSTGNITISASSSGGTVTSVSTGIGLSGGPITTSGTISIVTTFSAVGTYAFLYYNGGTVASGASVTSNGANLFPCDTNIANVSAVGSGQVWQCMGYMGGAAATLWLRIS